MYKKGVSIQAYIALLKNELVSNFHTIERASG